MAEASVAGGIGGSPGGRFVLRRVIGVSMFGGIIVLGTIRVSGATGMPVGSRKWWLWMIRR